MVTDNLGNSAQRLRVTRCLRLLAICTGSLLRPSTFYELVAKGDIKIIKIGRRTLVAQDELERYVASLQNAVT